MIDKIKETLGCYHPRPIGNPKRYAVLLPLIHVNEEWHILYQVRSQSISQPGEVSFPGGRVEEGETFKEAASRETMEELNIKRDAITILGEIDYVINEKRSIHCFVGELAITNFESLCPNKEEVERIFALPLDTIIKTAPTYYSLTCRHDLSPNFPFDRISKGKEYPFADDSRQIPFYEHFDETIWGLTARFTHRFIEIITK